MSQSYFTVVYLIDHDADVPKFMLSRITPGVEVVITSWSNPFSERRRLKEELEEARKQLEGLQERLEAATQGERGEG